MRRLLQRVAPAYTVGAGSTRRLAAQCGIGRIFRGAFVHDGVLHTKAHRFSGTFQSDQNEPVEDDDDDGSTEADDDFEPGVEDAPLSKSRRVLWRTGLRLDLHVVEDPVVHDGVDERAESGGRVDQADNDQTCRAAEATAGFVLQRRRQGVVAIDAENNQNPVKRLKSHLEVSAILHCITFHGLVKNLNTRQDSSYEWRTFQC